MADPMSEGIKSGLDVAKTLFNAAEERKRRKLEMEERAQSESTKNRSAASQNQLQGTQNAMSSLMGGVNAAIRR